MSRVFMKEEPWNPSEVFLRQGAICWTFDDINMFRSSPPTKSFTESSTQSPYVFTRPDRWLSSHICRIRFFQIFRKEEINLLFQQRESELDQYLEKTKPKHWADTLFGWRRVASHLLQKCQVDLLWKCVRAELALWLFSAWLIKLGDQYDLLIGWP